MHEIPSDLHGRAFTTAQAEIRGVGRRMLQGRRFTMIHPGIYRTSDTEPTLDLLVRAATLVLPGDAAVSHLTALRLRGLSLGPPLPLHFSTNHHTHVERAGLTVHRRQGALNVTTVRGHPVLGARRTFVDLATQLNDRNLLRAGDWLVSHADLDRTALCAYVRESHLDGVQRARRVAPLLSERVDSVRESDVRWTLIRAELPTPEVNVDIHDDHGSWLARGDLVYRRYKVLVEYDGWQHERDARQRQSDHLRRERLEAAGWSVVVVTSIDMASPGAVASRVRQTLRRRGWTP